MVNIIRTPGIQQLSWHGGLDDQQDFGVSANQQINHQFLSQIWGVKQNNPFFKWVYNVYSNINTSAI
jgi:hypothetical protein